MNELEMAMLYSQQLNRDISIGDAIDIVHSCIAKNLVDSTARQ